MNIFLGDSDENKNELQLPSGFYNHGTPCNGCRGCNTDDFVFGKNKDINSDLADENPLPLTQPIKEFSKSITTKPSMTTFGQLSKTTEASRNIFGSLNSSTSDQGLFTQLSFTPTKETTSIFGNNNIFGGNKSIFSKTTDEQNVSSSTDDVKKNFSFTNSLKPSVFGQNIFGQSTTPLTSLTASFGNNAKTSEDTAPAKPFSFGERLATTTPTTDIFGFCKF